MSIDQIVEARNAINEGTKTLNQLAKSAINDEVKKILALPGVDFVSWSQKNSEYNDEGMYPGVFGPEINKPFRHGDYDRWAYGYDGSGGTDPRVAHLKKILETLGDDVLAGIFGDESVVNARDVYKNGDVQYYVEYVGW